MTPLPSEVAYDRDEVPLTIGEWSRAFDSKNPLATRADRDAVRGEKIPESPTRNVATAVDLGAIEAALLDALEAVDRRAEINRRLSSCLGPSPDFDAAMDAERVACDAWFAALTAWREAGYPRALATARLDGARAMLREVGARAEGVAERHEGLAKAARAKDDRNRAAAKQAAAEAVFGAIREIRAIDPAAVVGSAPPTDCTPEAAIATENARAAYRVGFDDGIGQAINLLRRDEQHKRTIAAQTGTEPDDRTRMLHVADGLGKMAAVIGEIRPAAVVGSGS